jgi:hypothetical protein
MDPTPVTALPVDCTRKQEWFHGHQPLLQLIRHASQLSAALGFKWYQIVLCYLYFLMCITCRGSTASAYDDTVDALLPEKSREGSR